jgi:hypothetical protein
VPSIAKSWRRCVHATPSGPRMRLQPISHAFATICSAPELGGASSPIAY